MYNVDKYFDFEENKSENNSGKKKQQQQILLMVLLVGLGYYFLVHLPEEEKKKLEGQQNTDNRTEEEIKEELEKDAWDKGRIWELPTYSWADRIVKSKASSLLGEYQKFSSLFPNGDRNEKFCFSRAAPYTIYFPPSLQNYYDKGKDLGLEECKKLEGEEELILSEEINSWIKRAVEDPTRGDYNALGNNALLYGAPGTGKTATMKNICVQANKYPLVVVVGSDLTPTEADQSAEILPLHKFAYTISELEWSLVKEFGFEREENGEVRYILFVDEANQISNNSLIFQPNGLKFLKDCLEGVDKDESSKNLWVFATNHREQVEKATFRKGRLSNPLDFTWNWKVFKDFCESYGVELPERWKEEGQIVSEDEKGLAEFNKDVFERYFLGKDDDVPERKEFWNLFIEKNPDAKYIPESKKENQESDNNDDNNSEDEKEEEIEIGEFLEFFWHIKEKYSTSFDGVYKSVQKPTTEKVLETLTRIINNKLDKIIEQLEFNEDDEVENRIIKLEGEVNFLKSR